MNVNEEKLTEAWNKKGMNQSSCWHIFWLYAVALRSATVILSFFWGGMETFLSFNALNWAHCQRIKTIFMLFSFSFVLFFSLHSHTVHVCMHSYRLPCRSQMYLWWSTKMSLINPLSSQPITYWRFGTCPSCCIWMHEATFGVAELPAFLGAQQAIWSLWPKY